MKIPDRRYDALLALMNERYIKITDLLAEIAEDADGPLAMPYPEREQTHWPGCFRDRGHHNCAVALIERLAALVGGVDEN